MGQHAVIIGGGQAAAQAIATLNTADPAAKITLVCGEPALPYQRPPLSKAYLAGTLAAERLTLKPEAFYREAGVDIRLGVRAEAVDRAAARVALSDGTHLAYDRLLLATGSKVRRLNCPGEDLPGVHYLRSLADVTAIQADLATATRAAVIGGGYIGLEAAAVLRKTGLPVTVLEREDQVLRRVVAPEVGAIYAGYHTAEGVALETGVVIDALEGTDRVSGVRTQAGTVFPADLVIIGVGILPEEDIAAAAGLEAANGIAVDAAAQTSDPAIFAAGDCTRHPSALYGRSIRLESVQNAIDQAKAAASAMAGSPAAYDAVPWFWSDQYDLKLQIAGLSEGYDRIVLRGDPAARQFAAFYLQTGRLIAVDAVNSVPDYMFGRSLIAKKAEIPPEILADPGRSMKDIASGFL